MKLLRQGTHPPRLQQLTRPVPRLRHLSSMSTTAEPDGGAASLRQKVDALTTGSRGRWRVTPDGRAVERQFRFRTFAKAWVSSEPPRGQFGDTRASCERVNQSSFRTEGLFRRDVDAFAFASRRVGFHDGRVAAVQGEEPPPRVVQRKFCSKSATTRACARGGYLLTV